MVALKLSKNHILSLCSAFTAFFLSCSLAEVVRSPLFFTPGMVAHLLFLLLVILFLCYEGNSKFRSLIMLIMAVNLAMLYYPAVVITFPLLLYFIVGQRPMRLVRSGKSLFYLTSLLLPVLIVHTSVIPVIREEFWSLGAFDTSWKVNIIQLVYPIYFWVVFALSLLFLICSQRSTFDKKWVYWDLLLIIGIWAIIYFFPMWISYRIELYMRSFLAIFISGMISFSDKFFNSLRTVNLACASSSRFKLAVNPGHIVSVLTLCFLCSTLCALFTNYASDFHSYTSRDECDAAFWIRDNTPSDSYILTDPSSGYVIRGLALRNSSTFFVLPDGRMPSDASTILPNIRSLIHSFFNSESLDQAKSILGNFTYKHVFVVITSRTVVWAQCPMESIFTHPFENQDLSIFDKFLDPQSFQLLHSSPSVRIYFCRTPKPWNAWKAFEPFQMGLKCLIEILDVGCVPRKNGTVDIDIDQKVKPDVVCDLVFLPFGKETFIRLFWGGRQSTLHNLTNSFLDAMRFLSLRHDKSGLLELGRFNDFVRLAQEETNIFWELDIRRLVIWWKRGERMLCC